MSNVVLVNCKTDAERVLHSLEIIKSTEDRFFRCGMVKRTTGEDRFGTFRTGVVKYVKGVGLSYNPKEHDLKGVYEVQNAEGDREGDAYRMINLRGVFYIKADGVEYHYLPKPEPEKKEKKKK